MFLSRSLRFEQLRCSGKESWQRNCLRQIVIPQKFSPTSSRHLGTQSGVNSLFSTNDRYGNNSKLSTFSSSWSHGGAHAFRLGTGTTVSSGGSLFPSKDLLITKRQMGSSSSDSGKNEKSLEADDSTFIDLPSFGSNPITPEEIEAVTNASSDAAAVAPFEPTWWPSDQCLLLLKYVHETTGLPYGLTIVSTTLAFRILVLPLFINGQRNSSRMAHMQPELKALKDSMEKMGPRVDAETQLRITNQTRALFRKYDCNPLKSFLAPVATAPFFMSMFFCLKDGAPQHFPELLKNGGMLWFPDLSVADPYMIMPFISAATFLGMTELNKDQMMSSDPARGQFMINMFRGLAVLMVPLTMSFNSATFVYWTVNNTFSFGQALLFKVPAVKSSFGIWDPPKPIPGQTETTKGLLEEIKGMMVKKEEETNALAAERIKAHNEIIEKQKRVKKALMEREGLRGKGRKK